MGLDQYAYAVAKNEQNTDFEPVALGEVTIGVWRKHYDLQDYMEKLYRKKGGTAEDFNLVPLRLSEEDLMDLGTEIGDDATYMFIKLAFMAIDRGQEVYYDSWW